MDTYLLDWQETKHGKQPTPGEVEAWLKHNGLPSGRLPKVYANGTVQVETSQAVEAMWPAFEPIVMTVEDKLSGMLKALVEARAEVLRIPENRRSAVERLLLANTSLLLYGYGVEPDA